MRIPAIGAALLLLAGTAAAGEGAADPKCRDCGVVRSIQPVRDAGAGAPTGQVGGVVGRSLGGGAPQGGPSHTVYRVLVQMNEGAARTIDVDDLNGLVYGSKVRVSGRNLELIQD